MQTHAKLSALCPALRSEARGSERARGASDAQCGKSVRGKLALETRMRLCALCRALTSEAQGFEH
eukprot:13049353-Alexandrium_andersonii.AAC.1